MLLTLQHTTTNITAEDSGCQIGVDISSFFLAAESSDATGCFSSYYELEAGNRTCFMHGMNIERVEAPGRTEPMQMVRWMRSRPHHRGLVVSMLVCRCRVARR